MQYWTKFQSQRVDLQGDTSVAGRDIGPKSLVKT